MEVQAAVKEIVFVYRIGMRGDNRHAGGYLDALAEHISKGGVVWVLVIRIKCQHPGGYLVHQRTAGRLHQYIFGESGGQAAVGVKQSAKVAELRAGGQLAEKEQVGALLKAVSALGRVVFNKLADVVPAVFEHTLGRDTFALVNYVTMRIADFGNAGGDAGPVGLAQPPLDAVTVKGLLGYRVCNPSLADEFVKEAVYIF